MFLLEVDNLRTTLRPGDPVAFDIAPTSFHRFDRQGRAVTARATGKSDAHEGCQEQMRVKILHVPSQRAFMRSILASQARISCRVWSSAMRASVSDCCAESTSIDREALAANFDFVSR